MLIPIFLIVKPIDQAQPFGDGPIIMPVPPVNPELKAPVDKHHAGGQLVGEPVNHAFGGSG